MESKNKPRLQGGAYIRYSSTMQDDSFSLEAQLRQIKMRADADGVEIVKVYSDPATSAYKNRFRPGINKMLEDAAKGVFQILYVHKVDRLARRLEWALEIARKLQTQGIDLKAVEQSFDLATPEGKFVFSLLGSMGEFYSDNLSKETNKGKCERARQGYHNGWVPWGYKSEKVGDHKLAVPDPERAAIVRQAYERYSTGLYYDQDMADWMNSLGCKTMFGRDFTKDAMRDMLQNPFYKGSVLYRGIDLKTGKSRRKTDAEVIKGLHEPIIDEELFEKCKKVRAERRRNNNSHQVARHVYLLSGLIVCKHCGKRMRAQSAASGRYYRETSKLVAAKCKYHGKSVRAEEVEAVIVEIMGKLTLPKNWQTELQETLRTRDNEIDPQKEKSRLKSEIRRMREAYNRGLYENEEHSFWREVESLQAQLVSLEKNTPQEIRQAGEVLADLPTAWHAATIEERAELCKMILKQVVFSFEQRKVVDVVPRPEYEILFQLARKPD